MTREGLEFLLERVSTWSDEAQDELLMSIAEIEARHAAVYRLTDEDRAAVKRGLADVKAGRLVADEEVTALFNRYFA
jgi:predicted transcriptional regulator